MADKKKIIEHVKKQTQEYRKCPICGHEEWQVSDDAFSIAVSGGSSNAEVGCARCGNCGFVALFAEDD